MTQTDLNEMMQKAIMELQAIDINVTNKLSPFIQIIDSTSKLGYCMARRDPYTRQPIHAKIYISKHILTDRAETHNTIIHELLHATDEAIITNCKHGGIWAIHAKKVSRQLGVKIERTGTCEAIEKATAERIKYSLKCTGCGHVFNRQRLSELVKHPEKFKCGCGGNIERI